MKVYISYLSLDTEYTHKHQQTLEYNNYYAREVATRGHIVELDIHSDWDIALFPSGWKDDKLCMEEYNTLKAANKVLCFSIEELESASYGGFISSGAHRFLKGIFGEEVV